MKLNKLYSNYNDKFKPLSFNDGINYVIAETTNTDLKDTHNLGKTTLMQIIDFCLLKNTITNFTFIKSNKFTNYIFCLELKLNNGEFLSIRRSVKKPSEIKFRTSSTSSFYELDNWIEESYPLKSRAIPYLTSILDMDIQKDYGFRKGIGFLLREVPSEYVDCFKLSEVKNIDWKPYSLRLLGLDDKIYLNLYNTQEAIILVESEILGLESLIGDNQSDLDTILNIKEEERDALDRSIKLIDFSEYDISKINNLCSDIDWNITEVKNQIYKNESYIKSINESLKNKNKTNFISKSVSQIFKESSIILPQDLLDKYDGLVKFSKDITKERTKELKKQKASREIELGKLETELKNLNLKRKDTLAFIGEENLLEKYNLLSKEVRVISEDIAELKNKIELRSQLLEKRKILKELNTEKLEYIDELNINLVNKSESFKLIQKNFLNIIKRSTINNRGVISVKLTSNKSVNFSATIRNGDDLKTAQGDGNSYSKLIIIAYDLAIIKSYLNENFFRFVFHDGLFESLDNRIKYRLRDVMREYAASGVQQIITVIDSDLPTNKIEEFCSKDEILLTLSDKGNEHKLLGTSF